jgi:[NiFe] hydrogenase diaphorase moiety small subunit
MSDPITIIIDGKEVQAQPGQTILKAAEAAGVYIPRLCYHPELTPHGSCRVCTVLVNGRPQPACIQPVAPGVIIENESEKVQAMRRALVDMLFVEGNHFCPLCEKSGNCELQAMAYRLGIVAPQFPYQFPKRELDASHPDIWIDRNRCILCGRCVRASEEVDHKHVFDFVGRGASKRIAVNATADLAGTDAAVADKAIQVCPVGSLMRKRVGYKIPVGQRLYDKEPIGSDIEKKHAPAPAGK